MKYQIYMLSTPRKLMCECTDLPTAELIIGLLCWEQRFSAAPGYRYELEEIK